MGHRLRLCERRHVPRAYIEARGNVAHCHHTLMSQPTAHAIIAYLQLEAAQKAVPEDLRDLLTVAVDCIADAFGVDADQLAAESTKVLGGRLLEAVIAGTPAAVPAPAVAEVSEETKAAADAAKLAGNKAMAERDFPLSIAHYTRAIDLNPGNPIYYLNRAAAHLSALDHALAVADAEKAIEIDPKFTKAYLRLGLAKFALGDAKGSMDAYQRGLDAEGTSPSDAMKRGYETAKARVKELLDRELGSDAVEPASTPASAGAGAGAGGLPDLALMFGGAGGMPDLLAMMNNPQIMEAANRMMQNPEMLQGLMDNPMLKNMASQFMGGAGGAGGSQ